MSHQFYENFFAAHGLPLNYDIELASADLLLPVVAHNLGLAFMPEDLAAQALSENALFRFPLQRKFRTATSVSCGIPAVLSVLLHAA